MTAPNQPDAAKAASVLPTITCPHGNPPPMNGPYVMPCHCADPTPLDPVRLEAACVAYHEAVGTCDDGVAAAIRAWEAAAPAPVGEDVHCTGTFVYALTEDERGRPCNRWWLNVSAAGQKHESTEEERRGLAERIAAALRKPAGGGDRE